jgi:hypothetical protein
MGHAQRETWNMEQLVCRVLVLSRSICPGGASAMWRGRRHAEEEIQGEMTASCPVKSPFTCRIL